MLIFITCCYILIQNHDIWIGIKLKMDSEEAKANDRQFFDYVNKRDRGAMEKWIDTFVAEDFVNHSPAFNVSTDREGLKEMFRKIFEFFPDMAFNY